MIKKRKIALLLYRYFPYGGLQKDFLQIALELLSRNLEIKVFVRDWEGYRPKELAISELPAKRFSNHGKNIDYFNKVSFALRDFKPHLKFGFNKMPGLDIYLAADTCFKFQARNKGFFYKFLPRYKASIAYEEAVFGERSNTRVLLLNKKQKKEFLNEYKTNEEKLILIPPGLSPNWKKSDNKKDLRNSLGLQRSDTIVLFVGSDFKRKGLDRAIKALAHLSKTRLKQTYLVIAGSDNPQLYSNLATRLSIKEKVIFLGPREDIKELMKCSDILIHPAREEAAGNVIIEAMVSELPILTCKEVGFADYVIEHKAGIVVPTPYNQNDLNKELEKLLQNEKTLSYKNNLLGVGENDYFFSRFKFVGDFVERRLNV